MCQISELSLFLMRFLDIPCTQPTSPALVFKQLESVSTAVDSNAGLKSKNFWPVGHEMQSVNTTVQQREQK